MKVSEFKEHLKTLHTNKIKRPVLIEGAPGIGKTQLVEQAARELSIGYKVIHAPLMQPEDYGMPVIHGENKDKLKFVVSAEKFPLEGSECLEFGILLIDEIPQAGIAEQKIIANLLQAREIHGQRIKDGWTIVATGNRVKDGAGANKILGHLGARVTRLPLELSLDDWTAWALATGLKTELIAFIRFRPELLSNYDSKQEINATPRSWAEGVGAKIGLLPASQEFNVFAGDVGEGPAAEFLAFLKIFRNLPSPDAIMLDPEKAKVPKDPATQYAVCGALSAQVTPVNFGRALTYIKRLPPEFSVLFVKDCQTRDKEVCNTREYLAWASKEGAALLT